MQTSKTSTTTSVTSQPLASTTSMKTCTNPSPIKSTINQRKKPVGKGKNTKPIEKGKKCIVIATSSPVATTSTVSLPNLRNKLRDKAKVTVAMTKN